MFKKINTKTLLILIVVLGVIVLFNKFYQSKKEEDTFREEFVKIDTSIVNNIFIYPKAERGKEIKLIRNGNHWDLQNDKIKTIADSNAVRSLLSNFSEMKSVSFAGQDKSSWGDLQVTDTSGSKIKIVTTDNHTYSMVVGKFDYNNSNGQGITYIRHSDEEEVYAVQGYLSFNINQPFNSWRNKIFINGNKDDWTSITFNYPGDSSFVLNKSNNSWMVNGENADSSKAIQYISRLSAMQSSGFLDGYSPTSVPLYSINISGNNLSAPIIVHAFAADITQKFILNSSQNPEAYFSENQSQLLDKIFVSKQYFSK